MQIHVEEAVEQEAAPPARARVGEEGGPNDPDGPARPRHRQTGHILEHLSRIYGFAMLVVLCTVLFALALCFPEYTIWPQGDVGASPPVSASNGTEEADGKVKVPTINRTVWTVFTALIFPSVVSLRTMFASSSEDPHQMPGRARFSWKYAPQ